ncbi:Transmembrane amino acid transporter family protein [Aspergillus niger]|uniref:Transmembrane amino acid transporter family protein n=1 Tax=Aspergillus niger TaxID=5061 RepID=A0A505HR18_ASPNG|nr:Transmembrane amino acid transporter family protein [Aspergillus niger]
MTFAAETSSNGNSRCQSSGGKADHLQQAFVDDNVAISPNAPEEVPTLLKRIAMHGEAYLAESDENERTRILDAARSLVYALETPREAIIRHCWSQSTIYAAVETGVDLGIFTVLSQDDKPKTAGYLAAATGADPTVIARILKHLAAMGVITETGPDEYRRTGFSIAMMSNRYSDSYPCMTGCITDGVLALPAQLKKTDYRNPSDGKNCAFQRGFRTPLHFFDFLEKNPIHAIQFNNHMSAYHQGRPSWMDVGFYPVLSLVAEANISDQDVLLVDIGGSLGHDLSEFRRKWPQVPGRLILQDLPKVVEQARSMDLDPAIELMTHDFFTEQPIKGARAYYMHSVLHDWTDDDCRRILANIIPAMKRGHSKLLLNENVIPSTNAYWETTSLDIIMMADFASTERTEKQWRALDIPKAYASVVIQMRTQRIGLAHFLYKIKACGEGSQTPKHVLLACSRFTGLRNQMLDKIAARGSTPRDKITDYDSIISDPQAIRYVAEFLLQTGLLGQFSQVELDPEEPDPGQEHVGLRAMGIGAEDAG